MARYRAELGGLGQPVEVEVKGCSIKGRSKALLVHWDFLGNVDYVSLNLDIYLIESVDLDGWVQDFGPGQEDQNEAFEEIADALQERERTREGTETNMTGPRRVEIHLEAIKTMTGLPGKMELVITSYIAPSAAFKSASFRGRVRKSSGVLEFLEKTFHCSDWRIRQMHILVPGTVTVSAYYGATPSLGLDAIRDTAAALGKLRTPEITVIRNWQPSHEVDFDDDGYDYLTGAVGGGWTSRCPSHYQNVTPQVAHFRVRGDEAGASDFRKYLERMESEGLKAEPLAAYVERTLAAEVVETEVEEEEDSGIGSPPATSKSPAAEPDFEDPYEYDGLGIEMLNMGGPH